MNKQKHNKYRVSILKEPRICYLVVSAKLAN